MIEVTLANSLKPSDTLTETLLDGMFNSPRGNEEAQTMEKANFPTYPKLLTPLEEMRALTLRI